MSLLVALLSRLYRLILHLYPSTYREEFGSEQMEVFNQAMQDAVRAGGRRALTQVLLQASLELCDIPGAVLRVRLYRRDRVMLSQFFPKTSDQTPWGVALLSLAPLIIMGPLMVTLGYMPFWREIASSPTASRLTGLLLGLLFILGMVIGAVNNFPRWSYPYSVFGVLALSMIVYYFIEGKPWAINNEPYLPLFLIALVFLLTRLVPFLRPFQTNLRQDWTLLSYGLYSLTLIITSLHDSDMVPHFNLLVVLPSLVCLAGMLVHLRLASSMLRFEALLVSMFLGTLLWTLPFFDGGSMVGFPGGMYFIRFLLATWSIFLLLISAPILIGVYNRLTARDEPGASSPSTPSK